MAPPLRLAELNLLQPRSGTLKGDECRSAGPSDAERAREVVLDEGPRPRAYTAPANLNTPQPCLPRVISVH